MEVTERQTCVCGSEADLQLPIFLCDVWTVGVGGFYPHALLCCLLSVSLLSTSLLAACTHALFAPFARLVPCCFLSPTLQRAACPSICLWQHSSTLLPPFPLLYSPSLSYILYMPVISSYRHLFGLRHGLWVEDQPCLAARHERKLPTFPACLPSQHALWLDHLFSPACLLCLPGWTYSGRDRFGWTTRPTDELSSLTLLSHSAALSFIYNFFTHCHCLLPVFAPPLPPPPPLPPLPHFSCLLSISLYNP